MTLKVFNSLTRTKESFVSIEPGKVRMYVCGPTVYSYIHVGNARPLIVFDVVRRYLAQSGYDVTYIVNITDVEDKMIRKANETGTTVMDVAETYIAAFLKDIRELGIREAVHPRVTDNIPEIIAFIEGLVAKDAAYESGGDVYFRTAAFPDYGKLSHQNMDELQFGIRVEVDERKENAQDFVLWKNAKPGEIFWPSPWGEGRPGWHIECSAMARKYLGDTLDIHGGGHDLQFPHHECEVAQSETLTGKPLANYWMHNGYVNINNEKMSKSLGNGLDVKDMLAAAKPQAIRYFVLSGHYRNPLNYSDDILRQAGASVERIDNCVANVKHRAKTAVAGAAAADVAEAVKRVDETFRVKMDDDFNTPDAITAVFDLVTLANRYLQQEQVTAGSLELILQQFQAMDDVLGILSPADDELPDADIDRLIAERVEARKARNWARADEIRDLLTERGIVLEDTPQGIRWRRK
ncbi:cysteine--tRNA ligase [Paenibacillus cymbidii]|uniref:cysteine--tRNA ligase n=1 Tax=Paenibacillus cymbidii TaxID=1639034 RepID=UPI0010812B2E|nr:cysteine--tRNA ligase [Paenibacillus cymbidii]